VVPVCHPDADEVIRVRRKRDAELEAFLLGITNAIDRKDNPPQPGLMRYFDFFNRGERVLCLKGHGQFAFLFDNRKTRDDRQEWSMTKSRLVFSVLSSRPDGFEGRSEASSLDKITSVREVSVSKAKTASASRSFNRRQAVSPSFFYIKRIGQIVLVLIVGFPGHSLVTFLSAFFGV